MPARVKIDVVRKVAESRGGKLLSPTYLNNCALLKWQCSGGHVWEASYHHIKDSKSWCPTCANRIPATLEDAQELAANRGGKCLRVFSEDRSVKGEWVCHLGHSWEATVTSVRGSRWCPTCAGKRLTLQDMQDRAKIHGGRCLSEKYAPNVKLKWECKEGHTFWKIPALKSWCPTCAGRGKTVFDLQQLAASRGGLCLDSAWVNVDYKYRWQCEKGHQWSALFHNVKGKGSWCPYCKQFKTESLCREVCQRLWGSPFPKSRPYWLRNSRGNQMELDGFAQDLKVAFEFQGIQHYEEGIWGHDFVWLQERDKQKRELCASNGVFLLEIPYYEDVVAFIEGAYKCFAPA